MAADEEPLVDGCKDFVFGLLSCFSIPSFRVVTFPNFALTSNEFVTLSFMV